MPEPRLPNLIRAVVNYNTPSGPASNIMHFINESASPFGDASELINNAIKSWWGGNAAPSRQVRNWVHSGTSMVSVRYIDFSELNGQELELTNDLQPAGGGGTARMPPDLAVVISWQTGNTGARNRGRTYIPSLATTVNDTSTGLISSSASGSLAAGANDFIAACLANTIPLVVYSRVGASTREVLFASVDVHWDVQRRRGSD